MSYREDQRRRAVEIRDALCKDPGTGLFYGKRWDFVLKDPSSNLWAGIRDDAKDYFATHRIPWWKGTASDPTGHMLSSQVACLNHLYFIRQRKDIATAVLKALMPETREALPIATGFVEFEYIGSRQYLAEKSFTRGANCTSVDAAMLGASEDGTRTLFLIEWKYTESYGPEDLYVPARSRVYDQLIVREDGPFVESMMPRALYFEPFYQMMRQTLLAWQFVVHAELNCSRCLNIHVIPKQNKELKENVTSPLLQGRTIHDVWWKSLKDSTTYVPADPCELLLAARHLPDTKSWLSYLGARYW